MKKFIYTTLLFFSTSAFAVDFLPGKLVERSNEKQEIEVSCSVTGDDGTCVGFKFYLNGSEINTARVFTLEDLEALKLHGTLFSLFTGKPLILKVARAEKEIPHDFANDFNENKKNVVYDLIGIPTETVGYAIGAASAPVIAVAHDTLGYTIGTPYYEIVKLVRNAGINSLISAVENGSGKKISSKHFNYVLDTLKNGEPSEVERPETSY